MVHGTFLSTRIFVASIVLTSSLVAGNPSRADDNEQFFESKIRPVLVGTCFRCHGGGKSSGLLKVDDRAGLLKGGESGAAIVPGQPEASLLIKAIRREEGVSAMPPEKEKALRADQVADFVTWIKNGAVWPAKSAKLEGVKHWAFEPVRDVATPSVKNVSWSRTSLDPFILAKLEDSKMAPGVQADKLTLLRRATFDLTGLPPTPDEVDAFIADASPTAFATVVDRLLKAPAYGERWGRHWLDIVRYADTAGETADYPAPLAWRYRNYVINAFNQDKPYDEFLREQIAGDILAAQQASQRAPSEALERYSEQVTATGYLAISRRFGFDSENYHHLTIQDTIDTLGQSVLGLSLGCARCHDHKFDPVSMNDYYGLYGIFDSSRYSFPGSEQKQKVRTLAPLLPPDLSQPEWRAYETRVAELASTLTAHKMPVPAVVLRSLDDIDGDFELQAPAAGGSNGVLVPPWLYEGKIAVTTTAQSPFKNLHYSGRVGASIGSDTGQYRIEQALHSLRHRNSIERLFVNLDFRIGSGDAASAHQFKLGTTGFAAVELRLSPEALLVERGETSERLAPVQPNQWQNLQLTLDLRGRSFSGTIGSPGALHHFGPTPLSEEWPSTSTSKPSRVVDLVSFESRGGNNVKQCSLELDNLGIQEAPIAAVTTEHPSSATNSNPPTVASINDKLAELTGFDGDLELQSNETAPALPWGPGPNSVVKVSKLSQSSFRNIFPPGQLGFHMPNRAQYDGFGMTLPAPLVANPQVPEDRYFTAFDFRCASANAGGSGSWRYYVGHGPGNSAAVELFFNGEQFFRRSADARDAVCKLIVGEWYQVQLTLDLKAKSYSGTLTSKAGSVELTGSFASGWDGTIDYTFIDSYGHIGGVRPSLDADNFYYGKKPFKVRDVSKPETDDATTARVQQVAELRKQIAAIKSNADKTAQQLNELLVNGPFPMSYGMSEGTPHNVRIHLRGEPDQPGAEAPRSFIASLGGGPLPAETIGSGRLEMAQWLTRPENPLTARVMVNRIWQYHFGRGLVQTPNDLGLRGQPPTHPELLDHLAAQFVKGGWSIKAMHRLIMLSATYQTASSPDATPTQVEFYASFARRRLSAEEIRDSILMVSGELDTSPAEAHPFPSPLSWGFSQHGPFSAVYDHNRRSVYLMTQRLKRHPFLALFDGPDPNATTANRLITTVPTQALFFLNDPFVHSKADKWAARLTAASSDERQQITHAYRQTTGRLPTADELSEALAFLATYRSEAISANQSITPHQALAAFLRSLLGGNESLHVD